METTKEKQLLKRCGTVKAALAYLGKQDDEVVNYRTLFKAFKGDTTNHLVNYQTAIVLIRALNKKREPNWDDPSEWKYNNYFVMGGSSGFRADDCDFWVSVSGVGSRLCIFDSEAGKWLAERHLEVFKNWMLIIKKTKPKRKK